LDVKLMNGVMEVRETMATLKRMIAACVMVLGAAGATSAQVSASEAEQIHLRQQMATMDLLLQQAIVHGADMVYAQFKAAFPDRPRFSDRPRVSGFTLPGYGPVFTVDVPEYQVPILWEVWMRELQSRNATIELQRMRSQWNTTPPGPQRERLAGAITQLEQQLGLRPEGARGGPNPDGFVPAGLTVPGGSDDQKMEDPVNVYSREVKTALIDAMLTPSQLTIGADEWLTIVARSGVTNNRDQSPGDAVESSKGIIRVKGSVLAAFRAGTITKEDALKQVEVKQQ
jgi:hypothetical protein